MNADGSNERQLTFDPTTKKGEPAWSPDGRKIVFSAEHLTTNDSDLYVFDVTNGEVHNITAAIHNPTRRAYGTPDWSPVANEIVFSKNGELYWITSEGIVVRSRSFSGPSLSPRYSPNGTEIVFTVMDPVTNDIDIGMVTSAGTNFRIVLSGPSSDVQPDWSPDGESLVFASNSSGDYEIYTVPANGGARRNVTNRRGIDFHPSWR